jgi:shikimate kinase
MRRHVVLVGLPGSGKSTVGRLAASQLAAPFLDLDDEIERLAGQPVPEIFRHRGEAAFRELERAALRSVLDAPPAIVAPGGGWAAQPGALEDVAGRAFIIYLAVPVEIAAARCAGQGARPLLTGQPAMERLSVLLEERAPYYQQADVVVSNAAPDPAPVSRLVTELARRFAGW